jgi:hypothetical protein
MPAFNHNFYLTPKVTGFDPLNLGSIYMTDLSERSAHFGYKMHGTVIQTALSVGSKLYYKIGTIN